MPRTRTGPEDHVDIKSSRMPDTPKIYQLGIRKSWESPQGPPSWEPEQHTGLQRKAHHGMHFGKDSSSISAHSRLDDHIRDQLSKLVALKARKGVGVVIKRYSKPVV